MTRAVLIRGTIATATVLTIAFGLIVGMGGWNFKNLSAQADKTEEKVGEHSTEIALLKKDVALIPSVNGKLDILIQNQAQMAAVQGIKLATSTK